MIRFPEKANLGEYSFEYKSQGYSRLESTRIRVADS